MHALGVEEVLLLCWNVAERRGLDQRLNLGDGHLAVHLQLVHLPHLCTARAHTRLDLFT